MTTTTPPASTPVTRAEFDAALTALPGLVATSINTALAPVIATLQGTPDDFTVELAVLINLPATVAADIASAIAVPVPVTTAVSGSGSTNAVKAA